MEIRIIGTESLGVRGLSCAVEAGTQHILIDPGVALGYRRKGLLPHPIQVAAGEDVRRQIAEELKTATDIVISHFHGDHMPLKDANPYQLPLDTVPDSLSGPRIWMKELDEESTHIQMRREQLVAVCRQNTVHESSESIGNLMFSAPMPHGSKDTPMGTVMMTRVEEGHDCFVHASDIQLLADEPVSQILDWAPTILLASGPPIYLGLPRKTVEAARDRIKQLAKHVEIFIIDHHLLRSLDGEQLLDDLNKSTKGKVVCAADFMGKPRRLLEARRQELYERQPVPGNWHEMYAEGRVSTDRFRS